jgi:hypothetical protein
VTPEQFSGIIVAVTGLVAAIGLLVTQVRGLRKDLNGRMQELLDTSKLAAQKDGELAGRDFAQGATRAAPTVAGQIVEPSQRLPPNK